MKRRFKLSITILFVSGILMIAMYLLNYTYYSSQITQVLENEASATIIRYSSNMFNSATAKISTLGSSVFRSVVQLKQHNISMDSSDLNTMLSAYASIPNTKLVLFEAYNEKGLSAYAPGCEKEVYNKLKSSNSIVCSSAINSAGEAVLYMLMPYSNSNGILTIAGIEYPFSYFSSLFAFSDADISMNYYIITKNGSIAASNYSEYIGSNLFDIYGTPDTSKAPSADLFSNITSADKGYTYFTYANTDKLCFYINGTGYDFLYFVACTSDKTLTQSETKIARITDRFSTFNIAILLVFFAVIIVSQINHTHKLKIEKKRYNTLLSNSNDITWEYDIANDIIVHNRPDTGELITSEQGFKAFSERTNFPQIFIDDLPLFSDFCANFKNNLPEFMAELRIVYPDDNYVWYRYTGKKVFDNYNTPVSVIGHIINIDKQKRELEALKQRSLYDDLTNLLTKEAFAHEVNTRCASDPSLRCALFLVDLDDFRNINDTLGHAFGDAALIDLSTRFKNYFYNGSAIGRHGGDSVTVFVENFSSLKEVEQIAEHLLGLVHEIVTDNINNKTLTASIGIAIAPDSGINFDTLVTAADTAMYYVKTHNKDNYKIYDNSLNYIRDFSNSRHSDEAHSDYAANTAPVDSKIISDCIDMFTDSRDLYASMQMILSLIGSYFGLDRVNIIEFENKYRNIRVTYEWASSPKYYISEKYVAIGRQIIANLDQKLYSYNNNYYFDDIEKAGLSEEMHYFYARTGMKALFQNAILDHGRYIGYVSFVYCQCPHKWDENTMATLTMLTKLLGSQLIRIKSYAENERITRKDALVDAYNFNTFIAEAGNIISSHSESKYAIITSDLRQFKLINDNYGYATGNMIIQRIADIYNSRCADGGMLCRIAGDKFAALLPYNNKNELNNTVLSILDEFNHIDAEDGSHFKLYPAMGIYCIEPGIEAVTALDFANMALKHIKSNRSVSYAFFTEDMHSDLLERKHIEDIMEDALENGEFEVYFQPKIALSDDTLYASEALVRWNKPDVGIIPPYKFIPIFEDNGFIISIDLFILEQVCIFLRHLIDSGKHPKPVSVNFSRLHFTTDTLPSTLLSIINKHNISPDLIEVEVTESLFAADSTYLQNVLKKIHEAGFRISMDDFGSGLSSLNMLSDMPFDTLKIDKDFFHSQTASDREKIVITNVVKMASELEMDVVCEGVETGEQADFLRSINCHLAQGYFYDKPLPLKVFENKYFS